MMSTFMVCLRPAWTPFHLALTPRLADPYVQVQNTELERGLADARNKVEATATDVHGVVQERDHLMNNLVRMQVRRPYLAPYLGPI